MVLEIWACAMPLPRLTRSGRATRREPVLRFPESRSRHSATLPPARSLEANGGTAAITKGAQCLQARLPAVRSPNADRGVPDLLIVTCGS